ncbi:MAG TPA: elongation factor Ts [Candidatus Paceibacterota bacterium]|nr:elongation factor Ts [Candidatus Paceibacterota bacterium]HRZ34369.1 elongation factor Ts [Candidatus Paceibacterota bacterium]
MVITTEQIKALRDETKVSVMQCKKALEESAGDIEKAKILLRKQSAITASKKAERTLGAGTVASYIHAGGTVGAMVELLCETDFVAKNEEFQNLTREIAMQVAATAPEFVKPEDIDEDATTKAREIFEKEAGNKPADIKEKIIKGKLDAYFAEKTLINQPHIKNPEVTIKMLIDGAIQKFGEKIEIGRVARFSAKG